MSPIFCLKITVEQPSQLCPFRPSSYESVDTLLCWYPIITNEEAREGPLTFVFPDPGLVVPHRSARSLHGDDGADVSSLALPGIDPDVKDVPVLRICERCIMFSSHLSQEHGDPLTFEVDVIEHWREGRDVSGDPLLGVVVVVVAYLDWGICYSSQVGFSYLNDNWANSFTFLFSYSSKKTLTHL